MGATVEKRTLARARGFWLRRSQSRGDDQKQTARVSSLLRSRILPNEFFESALDMGSGRGRFIPILSSFCGHVWAVDIVQDVLSDIEHKAPSATAFYVDDVYRLPDGPHDLLWSAFFFQHLTDLGLFLAVCAEVKRVMQPGSRVILLENAKDRAAHICSRTPPEYAEALGLADYTSKLVTVNARPNDHWWIEGRMP